MIEPAITPVNAPFWAAAAQGRLIFQHCPGCGHNWLPAREACPECLAPDPEWRDATGAARLISWVVYHTAANAAFADHVPYVVAIVALDEGPRLYSNIVGGDDPEQLRIEQRLSLVFETRGGVLLPCFRPDEA